MFYAIAKEFKKNTSKTIDANAFARLLKGKAAQGFELRSPYDGSPLYFVPSSQRQGDSKTVRAHFARAAGYGGQDHICDHSNETHTRLADAVRQGARVLLSINTPLLYPEIDFSETAPHAAPRGGKSYLDWLNTYKGRYITVSVKSANDAVRSIRTIASVKGNGPGWHNSIFALHRGGVLPYESFVLRPQPEKGYAALEGLYGRLRDKGGIRIGQERVLGMPHLVQFKPTKKMLGEGSRAQSISGTSARVSQGRDHYLFSRLIFPNGQEEEQTDDYQELKNTVLTNPGGVWVLASPSITWRPDAEEAMHKGKMLRWVIDDIATQTASIGSFSRRMQCPAPQAA
jgi:hypothetical protein